MTQKGFIALTIYRDDFESIGYDASTLTDEQMQDIADNIGTNLWGDDATEMLREDAIEHKLLALDEDSL